MAFHPSSIPQPTNVSSLLDGLSQKELFLEKRKLFQGNSEWTAEHEAYMCQDDTFNYTLLKGLVPSVFVGKETPSGTSYWRKSDTFLTNFSQNYPDQVLSESQHSFVIGNTASHDTRQYWAKWDTDKMDRTPQAGMSYMHLLVIPKKRGEPFPAAILANKYRSPYIWAVYNVVTLNDAGVVTELINHFWRFWETPAALDKIIQWLEKAVEHRAEAVKKRLDPEKAEEFSLMMDRVRQSAEEYATELRRRYTSNKTDMVFFGFHPAPLASIAHLHMHAILLPNEFRTFSTRAHDWKTVSAQAVQETINKENRGILR